VKTHTFQILALAVTWMMITGSLSPQSIVVGLLLGTMITYTFRDLYQGEIRPFKISSIQYIISYAFSFVKELALSNLSVAYLIIHPSKERNSCVIEYKTQLESPNAVTILANSITLTPGTLVLDYREEEKMMLIHCLNLQNRQQTFDDIKKWEKTIQQIFGEKH